METPIEMPPQPAARELSWVMDSAVARSVSPFSLTEQVYAWPGQRWSVIIKVPSMSVENGRAWMAFFADLNGQEGTFFVRDSGFLRESEIEFGNPETDGAHTSGSSVLTRGWAINTQVLRKGQKIEIGGRMRQVIEDVYSDADGKAVLRCWPQCRAVADAIPIEWQVPAGVFRLRSVPEFTWDRNRLMAGFQFSADEVILP